ncbi:MAG: radical SAM family heme chaperone HemW [Dehalococcoidales bacterium]|nr:radical SAM family heme chaperone HemW [Dehalococcoidales bacterium]
MRGLYVHIPFCVKKCAYCDFYSLPGRSESLEAYVRAVIKEAEKYPDIAFGTFYLGGGTPSLLGAKYLKVLMSGLDRTLRLPRRPDTIGTPRNGIEATIEVNPESATHELLVAAGEAGFNRVSIGVQSLSDRELESVGRIHTSRQAVSAVKLAQEIGFKSISADLIIGLPWQTWESLNKSLDTLVGMGVSHLSVYCLSLEKGTPLADDPPDDLPSDDTQSELYNKARAFLIGRGFVHYEISNFALKGFECRHNLNYWEDGEYVGLGPSAASHLDGKRFRNNANLGAYLENPIGQIEDVEELSVRDKAAEEAMLRLRLTEKGLGICELTEKYGVENVRDIVDRLNDMVQEGLLVREEAKDLTPPRDTFVPITSELGMTNRARYRLSPSRIMTSNPIFARVLIGVK